MCNNVVALGNVTADGKTVFGKNSDRDPNEAHVLEKLPSADHAPGSLVQCTYLAIPQVSHTYAVMLGRPCWTWGAEMGTNEHGLVIGNTAVYTKVPYQTGAGLLGMDLLRLALERAKTSREALDVLTNLLETHVQGGNCGFRKAFTYHNSFLMADADSAWIVETAGSHWIARQVRDVGATSNSLTITTEYDLASKDLISYAVEQGWHKPGKPFNFKKSYGGPGLYPSYLWTLLGKGDCRQARLLSLLDQAKGHITPKTVMSMLRDHGETAGPDYTQADGYFENSVCMHAGFGPVRSDQTTGSLVTHFTGSQPTHWLTGTSAPCTSVFKPVWFDSGLPEIGQHPTGQCCLGTLWWQHESLHRELLLDYQHRRSLCWGELDALEDDFLAQAPQSAGLSTEARLAFSQDGFDRARDLTLKWAEKLAKEPIAQPAPALYQKAWEGNSSSAFVPGPPGTTTIP